MVASYRKPIQINLSKKEDWLDQDWDIFWGISQNPK